MLKDEMAPMSTGALFWQENAWAACLQVLAERPRRRKLQRLPPAALDVLSRCDASKHAVAERSFPLLNLVEMLCPPRSQSLLYGWRPLQNPLDNVQGFKDFKVTPSLQDNMRALGAQLFKGHGLARLVGKSSPGLRVGKQMRQTGAQHDRVALSFLSCQPPLFICW
jgi:hypothetical protein